MNKLMSGLLMVVWLSGCAALPPRAQVDAASVAGRYVGTLPCADCAGVRTDLTLLPGAGSEGGAYTVRETRVGARSVGVGAGATSQRAGDWSVQADAVRTLVRVGPDRTGVHGERHFVRASEQVLRLLDGQRRELPTELPRSLVRVPGDIDPAALVLTAGDNGSLVDTGVGSTLVVMLAANRSTGHRWQPLLGSDDVLVQSSARTYETTDTRPGSGGIEVFRFEAPRAGVQILRFEYRRPWERSQPSVQAVSFTLRVR